MIKFSIFNSGGKRAKASGQHLFGRDHRTWGARAARGGGALWIGGLRHLSLSLYFFLRRNGNQRSSSFLIVHEDDLYESKVIINPERFNFLHFWRSGDIDLRHNSEQITDLAFSIPPAQHFRLAVTFFLKQWRWFRSPRKIFYTKFVNSLARVDERLNIFFNSFKPRLLMSYSLKFVPLLYSGRICAFPSSASSHIEPSNTHTNFSEKITDFGSQKNSLKS